MKTSRLLSNLLQKRAAASDAHTDYYGRPWPSGNTAAQDDYDTWKAGLDARKAERDSQLSANYNAAMAQYSADATNPNIPVWMRGMTLAEKDKYSLRNTTGAKVYTPEQAAEVAAEDRMKASKERADRERKERLPQPRGLDTLGGWGDVLKQTFLNGVGLGTNTVTGAVRSANQAITQPGQTVRDYAAGKYENLKGMATLNPLKGVDNALQFIPGVSGIYGGAKEGVKKVTSGDFSGLADIGLSGLSVAGGLAGLTRAGAGSAAARTAATEQASIAAAKPRAPTRVTTTTTTKATTPIAAKATSTVKGKLTAKVPTPSDDAIRARAYKLHADKGYQHGSDVADWNAARQALQSEARMATIEQLKKQLPAARQQAQAVAGQNAQMAAQKSIAPIKAQVRPRAQAAMSSAQPGTQVSAQLVPRKMNLTTRPNVSLNTPAKFEAAGFKKKAEAAILRAFLTRN